MLGPAAAARLDRHQRMRRDDNRRHMNAGIVYATLAFVMWGLFPLYLRHIAVGAAARGGAAPLGLVVAASCSACSPCCAVSTWLRELATQPRQLALFGLSALLLSCNWLLYVYAVQSGQVVEASLGYFINPIVNVLLGVLVLKERLNRVQWAAVALAAAGVLWLTLLAGRLPWIALVLAVSFGFYGLMRKTATLGALEGLTLETLLLAPLVVPLLAWWSFSGNGVDGPGRLGAERLAAARPGR